jgi:hypothetical protein
MVTTLAQAQIANGLEQREARVAVQAQIQKQHVGRQAAQVVERAFDAVVFAHDVMTGGFQHRAQAVAKHGVVIGDVDTDHGHAAWIDSRELCPRRRGGAVGNP